jgi:hypothetical protein
MCETSHDDITPAAFVDAGTRKLPVVDLNDMVEELLPVARFIAGEPEVRRTGAGFIGYGATKPGDKVLLAADTHYDWRVVEATARALRERGAKVDVVTVDVGPDRDFTDLEDQHRDAPSRGRTTRAAGRVCPGWRSWRYGASTTCYATARAAAFPRHPTATRPSPG